jgi:hypothetical protein
LHQNGGKWFADAPGIKGFDLRTGIQEVLGEAHLGSSKFTAALLELQIPERRANRDDVV